MTKLIFCCVTFFLHFFYFQDIEFFYNLEAANFLWNAFYNMEFISDMEIFSDM